jgi:uncharacterized phage protein gp47/JayE
VPIDFPSYQEIINRTRSDVARLLPGIDPTVYGSFVRGFTDSQSGRAFDIVLLQQQLLKQLFPQTADGEFLERWAEYEGISRNAATVADGNITITGTVSTAVPALTNFSSSAGDTYQTQAEATISATAVSISSLVRSGQEVTATTSSDHSFASGISVTIAGANEVDYNGTYTITVTAANEFTYTITGTPTTPATGTITASCNCASVEIQSVDTGSDKNLDNGARVLLVTPITGIDTNAYVQYSEISGGADIETDAALLTRILQSRSNPVENFNIAAIEKAARTVSGVTRVKVKRVTPEIGDVTILFVRDDDDNIIPDSGEVSDVFDVIFAIAPANVDSSQVIVTAPTPITTNYSFSSISPNSNTMQAAIEANLIAMYRDVVTFETTITEDVYRSVIIDTIDPDTGDKLQSFTLSTPTTDITVSTDEIGVLGEVSF